MEQFRDAQLQDNPAAATKAVRRIAEDSRTGLKTHWEIGPTRKYIHPKTKQWRDFNELRIRKGSDGNAHRVSRSMRGWLSASRRRKHLLTRTASTEPRLVIKPGRAIGKVCTTRSSTIAIKYLTARRSSALQSCSHGATSPRNLLSRPQPSVPTVEIESVHGVSQSSQSTQAIGTLFSQCLSKNVSRS